MLALRHLLSFRRFRRILLISSPSPTFKPSYSQTFQYSVRTGPVEASLFRLPILATRHSSLASIPFRIRTYEKCARNSFTIRTSKTQHLKSFRIRTYKKRRGGGVVIAGGVSLSRLDYLSWGIPLGFGSSKGLCFDFSSHSSGPPESRFHFSREPSQRLKSPGRRPLRHDRTHEGPSNQCGPRTEWQGRLRR